MLLTQRAVYEGELPPRFYGLAYCEPFRPVATYYLIPFNLLVRWWRGFWYWLVAGRGNRWERALSAAYAAGKVEITERAREQYSLGFDAGKKVALDIIEDQFQKDFGRPL